MKRRKLFCLLLAAVMLFSLAACGKGEDETKDPICSQWESLSCTTRAQVS